MPDDKPKRKTHTSAAVKDRYNKKTYRNYTFRLRFDEDAALIEKLGSVESCNAYLRDLIRRDLQSE